MKRFSLRADALARLILSDRGQDLVEYALLSAFVAVACLLVVANIGRGLNDVYDTLEVSNPPASSSQPASAAGARPARAASRPASGS
ncbi:MAG TPA: hypothetical protein VL309_02595 [Vicinamibacterales bacterium]|nr:hypothetical protein [Vicinamibacterales bacterium]